MKLEKAKRTAEEMGLEVGSDLILFKNGKEVGEIYRVGNTDQYALTADFQESPKFTDPSRRRGDLKAEGLENMVESGDRIELGKDVRSASGEIAIVDEVKKWGVTCYVDKPTDRDRLYLRVKYGSFALISSGKTIH